MMQHKCTVNKEDPILDNLKWYQRIKLISHANPRRMSYFRSDVSVREEIHRHLRTSKWTIHPFSTFRGWYDVFLVYLYLSVILSKPFDAAFMTSEIFLVRPAYKYYTIITDVLCWMDIVINFFTGFELPKNRKIELRLRYIAKHYVFGLYFFFDVISSIPRPLFYHLDPSFQRRAFVGIIIALGVFKAVRISTFVVCINRSAEFFHIQSKGKLFLLSSSIVAFIIVHLMGCLQFFVPKLMRINWEIYTEAVNYKKLQDFQKKKPMIQYLHCMFQASAYVLGVHITVYKIQLPEEYILAIFTYMLGKILIAYIWIILAVAILNSRLMEIKYEEMINQLQEYMRQKQLPLNLSSRILQYFSYKYRNKYFKEYLINSLLSENLRNEANLHICRSLIKNVSLFADLDPMQLKKIVDCLILEIFMPNDTIIHAGTIGDAMYFLFSGTVAVYSRAGKEICHLQDGAYFGEIALLLKGQLRSTTIVALETSQVYRLMKKDFEKCLMTNKEVKAKMLKFAESRLQETTKLDEEYREKLFEESFRTISTHHTK